MDDCETCGELINKKEICYFKAQLICEKCFNRFKNKGKVERYQEKNNKQKEKNSDKKTNM